MFENKWWPRFAVFALAFTFFVFMLNVYLRIEYGMTCEICF